MKRKGERESVKHIQEAFFFFFLFFFFSLSFFFFKFLIFNFFLLKKKLFRVCFLHSVSSLIQRHHGEEEIFYESIIRMIYLVCL